MEKTKQKSRWNAQKTWTIVGLGMLTALVVVLQWFASGIKLGEFSITLTLVPIIVGAALFGWKAGAWLGFAFGMVVLFTPDVTFFMSISIPGTIITVLLKGVLAGMCAGIAYNLLSKKNQYAAVITAGVVSPVVNTGVFLLGCFTFFFKDYLSVFAESEGVSIIYFIIFYVIGFNFLVELAINLILASAIVMIINVVQKHIVKSK